MPTILGIDLGVASIGWALIEENDKEKQVLAIGSRVIPLSTDDKDEFSSGNKISKNQKRTVKRTIRKGYDRYQQRRENLKELLQSHGLFNEQLLPLTSLNLYGLRSKAVTQKISAHELGRVLYHLNQKRGYKSSRLDANLDKKDTEYVATVKSRHQRLKENGNTIGQEFYAQLQQNGFYKIKKQVFPREAYQEEFDAIITEQRKHHPVLTDELVDSLRDKTIFYQRKLKSQKGLVSICEFEGFETEVQGKNKFIGPKVAPKSSPLFQVCKVWETINTITLKNKTGQPYQLSLEEKKRIFEYLDTHPLLSFAELFKLLKLKKEDGWYGNKQLERGLQGNIIKTAIAAKLAGYEQASQLLSFNLVTTESEQKSYLFDKKSGQVKQENNVKQITPAYETEPLYRLWHVIYSLSDADDCKNTLMKNFGIPEMYAQALTTLDFTKLGFGNKSARAIRKILPYLMEGFVYSDACMFAGYNHSNSYTKEEKAQVTLKSLLPILPKNSLRQPVVEKILNQLINLVNAIIQKYGAPTEIRVELARELKQNREERADAFKAITQRDRENKTIIEQIEQHPVKATRGRIIKYRLFQEINNHEAKVNAICIYCGKPFTLSSALNGDNVDVEHIIPKARLFDDSQSNKTLSHRSCNEAKKNRTAFDYMQSKSHEEFEAYLERVEDLYKRRIIGKAKRDKLLMSEDKIPQNFIERQLRETQYIARKAKEILGQICRNVHSTSGSVTEYLRRIWGWEDALMNLQLADYRAAGLTEWREWETRDGQVHKREVIKDWSKRDDHRHHALDALAIACTRQSFIQRLNTLNAQHTKDEMFAEVKNIALNDKLSLLDKYMIAQRPFTTKYVQDWLAKILVSFKPGKRAATISSRQKTITPRGPLSEETIYGKIKTTEKNKSVKYLFENPQLIFKPYIKQLVEERLAAHENDSKKALASLKKDPLYLDEANTIALSYGTCYKEEYVVKYPLESLKAKDAEYIVDEGVKAIVKQRLAAYGNKEKEAFKDLENNPVWYNAAKKIPILSVRCFTGLSAVEAVKKDATGRAIGYAKPGNNHHIALYINEGGDKIEHICSFWMQWKGKNYGCQP